MAGKSLGERMAVVETWQTEHEQTCASRWALLIKLIGWGGAMAFTIMLGIAGFGLKALYEGQQHQAQMLEQLVTRSIFPAAPGQR